MNQKQGETLKTKVVSGGVTSSPQWLHNMGFAGGCPKEGVLTTAETPPPPPPNTHMVSWDQLCVTQQHNQSAVIAFIDVLQKSLTLFDDPMLPVLLL